MQNIRSFSSYFSLEEAQYPSTFSLFSLFLPLHILALANNCGPLNYSSQIWLIFFLRQLLPVTMWVIFPKTSISGFMNIFDNYSKVTQIKMRIFQQLNYYVVVATSFIFEVTGYDLWNVSSSKYLLHPFWDRDGARKTFFKSISTNDKREQAKLAVFLFGLLPEKHFPRQKLLRTENTFCR